MRIRIVVVDIDSGPQSERQNSGRKVEVGQLGPMLAKCIHVSRHLVEAEGEAICEAMSVVS
jgi:hypothetical protein